jgi:hypothetical protein
VADKRLHLAVLTPAGALLDVADVAWVQALLSDGSGLGIYPGHAPLLAETRRAALRYATTAGKHQTEDLEAGILQVTGNDVLLFTGGPSVGPFETPGAPADEAQQFDRLAGALLAALQADPAAAWGMDDAEGT